MRSSSAPRTTIPDVLEAAPPPESFHPDLYVVAATVIPVFFLALMLPSGPIARYSIWTMHWRSERLARYRGSVTKTWLTSRAYEVLSLPVVAVLLLGTYGEIRAALALDDRRASSAANRWVLAALIGLTIATAVAVIFTNSLTSARQLIDKQAEPDAPAEPSDEQAESDELAGEAPP